MCVSRLWSEQGKREETVSVPSRIRLRAAVWLSPRDEAFDSLGGMVGTAPTEKFVFFVF
jgi:hypothetical protein